MLFFSILVISLNFSDGKEHDFFLLGQWFSVFPNQCFIDYTTTNRNYFAWVSFPNKQQAEAIKEGKKQVLSMCNNNCKQFAIICNL